MGVNKLPKVANIAQAVDLGKGSTAVMSFLQTSLLTQFNKERVIEDYSAVLEAVDETKNMAQLRDDLKATASSNCWHATANARAVAIFKPDSVTHMDGAAIQGIQELNQALGKDHELSDIVMAYYIDDNSLFNRGYIVNKQVIDDHNPQQQKMLDVIDKIFHSWLVSNNMSADDSGVIYTKDKQGNLTQRAKREDITRLLAEPDTGLSSTIEKIDPNIKLTMLWTPPEEPKAEARVGASAGG